ncbi:protoheme IX farnesyltransferase [Pseudodesulfovibrio sediminis]|uniref:heme o synthase n=1 Tax=Pseudodesulfovibrio sediminis TaxID=2810563 RepID=A0ABN6EX26_9BACT|nr:protoheme IX farnesyltransferase [Pseudodesulfovibrio sediminis]BCS89725.1 hypothetical protein PSDVSF_29670 [Pseudodesulfovibrio sediminis]
MIRDISSLMRPSVSLAVAAGTLFGALYRGSAETGSVVEAVIGAFILCGGCSALNQIQERDRDARMERTRHRPVAAGRLTVNEAWPLSLAMILSGLVLFFLAGGWTLLMLGMGILLVYNGVYTPLKRVTPTALLAGGCAGAVPPLVGWLAAGGDALDPRILSVTAIFYLWQVPHFWLLAEKHRADYERAGFAMLHAALPPQVRSVLMALWVSAYFIGLGCLAGLSGAASLQWVVPVSFLLAGGVVVGLVVTGRIRPATFAMHASLPLGLMALLLNRL